MGYKCPKCGYERQPGDLAPEYECPSCGVIYTKVKESFSKQREEDQKQTEQKKKAEPIQQEGRAKHSKKTLNALDQKTSKFIKDKFQKENLRRAYSKIFSGADGKTATPSNKPPIHKPHQCRLCSKRYKDKDNLILHLKTSPLLSKII